MASIPQFRQDIVEIVCMFEKERPTSFMDLQVHILIHVVDEVKLVGVVYCHWMLILESYMKKFTVFVRWWEKLEGSVGEGYISYESFYYMSEYIKNIDNTSGVLIWDDEWDEEKIEGALLQTNRKRRLIKSKWLIICPIFAE